MTDDEAPRPQDSGSDADRRSGFDRREHQRRHSRVTDHHDPERRSGLDRRVAHEDRRQADRVDPDALSLGRRMRQPKTIISLVVPIVLLLLFVRALPGFHLEDLPGLILAANGWLLLAAFAVYYLGFPLRGYRWARLVRGTGYPLKVRDSTEIIFISWTINCLVPAKLGDLYRAYLLKINSPVSLSRTFGTVFIERVLDLFAIVVLGLAAGYWSFRNGLPTEIQILFGVGVVIAIILAAGLLTMRNFGRRVITALPFPHKVVEFYDRFEEGVFGALGLRSLPLLLFITALIWATEAGRLFLVVEAMGFDDVHLGISGAFFVALTASLLTAVPLTPAGIGFVEGAVVFLLTFVYGVGQTEALAIVLVDRAISVLSVIILGSIAYVLSPLRRGEGLEPHAPGGAEPEPAGP
ncbi:MAG TPA: lysylphosphatidylglycerol synthase transmembrane domain-containing protein [Candidatus Limnocylindrales bacterium]|nr:lysylphosphatidylglycerol synthase transmembrane domain-containing protein [Candidatus Limnocylindrales bacterium]